MYHTHSSCEYVHQSPQWIGGGVYGAARPRVDETNSSAACQIYVQLFGNKRARKQDCLESCPATYPA
jgi:hypothetical protein